MSRIARLVIGIMVGCCATLRAATLSLAPAADTTLIQIAPTNNMGGQSYFNAGTTLTSNYNRGMVRFDLSSIPPGSRITSVQLVLEVVLQGTDMPASSNFRLHRVLKPWGEGTNTGNLQTSGAGRGSAATTNEATWLSRFAFTTNVWAVPGGQADVDYASGFSAEQFVYDVNSSPYTFGSSSQMVADVQSWLDHPESNFGWLLKTQDEAVTSTARRFGSRENKFNAPRLDIEFVAAPIISSCQVSSNQFSFVFNAEASRSYTVESRVALPPTGSWSTLTNVPAPGGDTAVTIFDTVSSQTKFYRVLTP